LVFPIFAQQPKTHKEPIEIRVSRHRPAVGYFIVDPNEDHGFLRVEMYLSHSEHHQRPMLQFFASRDEQWYDLFCNDFKNLWAEAQNWQCKSGARST